MLQKIRKLNSKVALTFVILISILGSGCALGITKINVTHDPLERVENKKEGNILVRQFTDKRKDTQYIGNKRNIYGMVLGHIGLKEGTKLEVLLTTYFAEALREAGYNAVILESQSTDMSSPVKFDAILDGEIIEFWLDLYFAVWHKVGVKVRAISPISQIVLWEKDIRGEQTNVLIFGIPSEFEKVISQALTKALNQAAKEFSSDEFYNAIKKSHEEIK